MQIGAIEGVTRTIGKSQGYLGLPLRDDLINCSVNGQGTPAMTTGWHPTPDEIEALNQGAAVHVRLLGQAHPPILVMVGPTPDEATVEHTSAGAGEPFFIRQGSGLHTEGARRQWVERQLGQAISKGVLFYRAAVHPDRQDLCLFEGWTEQPTDQGKPRWIDAPSEPNG